VESSQAAMVSIAQTERLTFERLPLHAVRFVRAADGVSVEAWEPEPIVDPIGFAEATVGRRLRKFGTAA
jgi:hypothetical protein